MAHDSYGPVDGVVAQIEAQQCQVRAFQRFALRSRPCAALGKWSGVADLRHNVPARRSRAQLGCAGGLRQMIGQFTDVDNFGAPLVGQREYGYVTMQSSCNTSTQVLLEVRPPCRAYGSSSAARMRGLCFGDAVRQCGRAGSQC